VRVLITGGGGFIGSHLADALIAAGDDVLVLDNYATGSAANLTEHDRLTIVEGSVADVVVVEEHVSGFAPDVIVHAAASYQDPDAWEMDALINAAGSAIVAQAADRAGVERLIYLQTALCYGVKPLEQPVTTSHPLRPFESSYAISKTAGECYVRLAKVPTLSFRLANVYGPRNLSGPLPTFFARLTAGKACFVMDTRRDFVYVDDLIALLLRAVRGEGDPGVYHASSGSDCSIKDLYDATVAALDMPPEPDVEVRPRGKDDAFTILLDPTGTRAAFPSWVADTPLETGVREAVRWYRENGVERTFTHLRMPETRV
jgi:UDP-glucose 4-epimerase